MSRIIQGDCIEVMRGMEPESVDMIFTDPPYGHNNNSGDLIARREAALGRGDYIPERDDRPIANDGKEANELVMVMFAEARRLLVPGGCICCCCCGGGPDPQFARWSLWLDEAVGFKHMVIWDKGPMGMGWHYRRSYEVVLIGQKPGAACKWYDTTDSVENIIRAGTRVPKIIPRKDQHPTEKPWQLAERFILLHSAQGDLVLDPFAGSGSTGEACVRTGRRFIGIEINADYVQMAEKRIRGVTPGMVFAEAEG